MKNNNISFLSNEQKKDLLELVNRTNENRSIWIPESKLGTHDRKFLNLSQYFDMNLFNFIMYNFSKLNDDMEGIPQIESEVEFYQYNCPKLIDDCDTIDDCDGILYTMVFRDKEKINSENYNDSYQLNTKLWLKNLDEILNRLEKNKVKGRYRHIYCD